MDSSYTLHFGDLILVQGVSSAFSKADEGKKVVIKAGKVLIDGLDWTVCPHDTCDLPLAARSDVVGQCRAQ